MSLLIHTTRESADYRAVVKLWLERSAPLPIPIELRGVRPWEDCNKQASQSMVNMPLSVAPRWKTLEIHDNTLPGLTELAPDSLKALEEVDLDYRGETEYHRPV
ncbi:hypothetical protein DFH09DRAFT_1085179 [Mycena vulgaris]|nr:hypothetical protein DFH09DRAFT_1085179 [Mycena vulgaris]